MKAFNLAFEQQDRVRLWMMNHNPFITKKQTKEWEWLYKSSGMGHRINILPRVNSHAEVAAIMSQANCGVFPARAEGWNLELLEMMSMGKPVIATNYSAHTQFCNLHNTLPVNVDSTESAYDGVFFDGSKNGEWATLDEPQIDAIVEHMRFVHKNRPSNRAGINTATSFSWFNTAKILVDELEDLS